MQGTVLVVDDETSILKAYGRLLRLSGYETRPFSSGEEFLRAGPASFAAEGGCCIVMDLQIGDVSGLDVQRALPRVHPPIVFISARGDIASSVLALKAGALNFLEKPVDKIELIAAIDNALEIDLGTRHLTYTIERVRKNVESLTCREEEVLRQVITGRLNKNIASELGITEKTVKVHRARMFQKMGVRSVAELSRVCVLAGIDPADALIASYPLPSSSGRGLGDSAGVSTG